MANIPDRPDPVLASRTRGLLYLSNGCILFASVVLALTVGKGWGWGPAVLAVVAVAFAVACSDGMFRFAMAKLKPTDEQRQRARTRRRKRNVVMVPMYVTFAVSWAVIAGSLESYWPAAGIAAVALVVGVIVPFVFIARLSPRAT